MPQLKEILAKQKVTDLLINHPKFMLFISYSQKDKEQVQRFLSKMSPLINKKDIWIDYEQIDLSKPIKPSIDAALQAMQYFIVFVSNSSRYSPWVNYEYHLAKQLLSPNNMYQVILEQGIDEFI